MGKLHAPFKTSSSFNHTQSSTFMLRFHRTFSKCTILVFQISGVGALSVSRTFLEKPKPSSKAKTLHGGAEPLGCGPCLPSPRKACLFCSSRAVRTEAGLWHPVTFTAPVRPPRRGHPGNVRRTSGRTLDRPTGRVCAPCTSMHTQTSAALHSLSHLEALLVTLSCKPRIEACV